MIICKECGKEFTSLDSLRKHRVLKHKIPSEQSYIDYVLDGKPPECACGCGEKTKYLMTIWNFGNYNYLILNNLKNNKRCLKIYWCID